MTNVDNFSGPVQYLKIYIVEGNYAQIILCIAHFAISSDVRSQYDDLIQGGIIWTVSQFLKGCKSVIVCRWSTFPLLFLDGLVWVISRRTLHWEDGEAGSHSLWPFQTSWGQPAGNKKMPMSNHPIKRVTCPSYWSLRRCCRSTSILSISTPINFAETYKFVQMKLISICLSEDLIIPQHNWPPQRLPPAPMAGRWTEHSSADSAASHQYSGKGFFVDNFEDCPQSSSYQLQVGGWCSPVGLLSPEAL